MADQTVSPLSGKAEVLIPDARGRVITLKRPGVLAQYRLVDLLGAETAKNTVYMNMVLPMLYVAKIDDDPAFFSTRRELDALISLLDEDGISAVLKGVEENYAPKGEGAEAELKK